MSAATTSFARDLEQLLDALARFSAPGPGVSRFAYDAHWIEAHRWLRAQAQARGLHATSDTAGNLLFHDPALAPGDPSARVIFVGSHLDSVRNGGRFDGAYGAVAGLLLAAAARGRQGRPVVGFVSCEEEQSRFDSHMMGARSLLGLVSDAELDAVHDAGGVTWREALSIARAAGCAAEPAEPAASRGGPRGGGTAAHAAAPFVPPFRASAMLELHIEQGPVLEAEGLALGIVERIAGYRRLRATLTGAARHTGTTPHTMRRDALAAAAEIALVAEALAREAGDPARVSCGHLRAAPGLYNVVAGACEAWLEVRHGDGAALEWLAGELSRRCEGVAERRGLGIAIETVSRQEPTALSGDLAAIAEVLARERGIAHRRMPSGAAHDAMEFARAGIPALMLFVPSRGGASHTPDEFTDLAALAGGVAFADALIERLSREPE